MARQRSHSSTAPISKNFQSLVSVDRVISEIRRGRAISIYSKNKTAIIAQAAEGITDMNLAALAKINGTNLNLALTAERAIALNLPEPKTDIISLNIKTPIRAEDISSFINPLEEPIKNTIKFTTHETEPFDSIQAGVLLSKLARLLPAICFLKFSNINSPHFIKWQSDFDVLMASSCNIFKYEKIASKTLLQVSEATLPLKNDQECRVINFRSLDGGVEHLAVVIGKLNTKKPILTRIHSECFTGDVLGSLRCDCGNQLHNAISKISKTGSGILLYLRQEGRGIGLINKLRAYCLQDRGYDTYEANNQLGFNNDERIYLPAAKILSLLNVKKIRLLSNNPEKVAALTNLNVDVTERIQHSFQANKHNKDYIKAKKIKGHRLK